MNTKPTLAACGATLLAAFFHLAPAFAQGTAFTYQGRLDEGVNPAAGLYDLRFTIYDSASEGSIVGGPVTNSPTSVSNGLFTVTLDFGDQFSGANRWLEIAVRTNGGGAFSTLSPRQALTATPYAVRALNANAAVTATTAATANGVAATNIFGTMAVTQLPPNVITNGASGVNFTGTFSGNAGGLSNLNSARLTGLLRVADDALVNVGYTNNGGIASGVAVSGNYAYLANGPDGLRVYDIGNPANPINVGHSDDGGWGVGVAVSGTYAYLANDDDGLRVYDVSNPASPINVGYAFSGGNAAGVAVSGNYAYLANGPDGLRIYDISNPANPINVGHTNNGGYAGGVAVSGNYAYLASWDDGLRVYDISNPANPINVGHTNNDGGYAASVAVSGTYAYLANSYDGLRVYDISNPADPINVGSAIDGGVAAGVAVSGNYAYLANRYDGLRVFDISNPANPTNVGYSYSGDPSGVAVSGNCAYLANSYDGLHIYTWGAAQTLFLAAKAGISAGPQGIEVGAGVTKAANAGKIAYQQFSDGLDIMGAGTNDASRKISFFAEGGSIFDGPVTAPSFTGSFAGDGSGLTNLATSQLIGTVADAQLSGNVARRSGGNTFSGTQTFADAVNVSTGIISVTGNSQFNFNGGYNDVTMTLRQRAGDNIMLAVQDLATFNRLLVTTAGVSVTGNSVTTGTNTAAAFVGNGAGLTGLNTASFASGILADARLSDNVALRNAVNSFTGNNTFAGTVGIGTTNPAVPLQVEGAATWPGGNSPARGAITGIQTSGDASSAGVVGLSRVPGAYGVFGQSDTTLAGPIGPGAANIGVAGLTSATNGTGVFGSASASSGLTFGVVGNAISPQGFAGYFLGRGFFSGNVGIGTTAPSTALHVNGTVTATAFAGSLTGNVSGNGAGLTNLNALQLSSGTVADARLSSNVALRNAANSFTGGSNMFAGNVGIGTASPQRPLQVGGANGFEGMMRFSSVSTGGAANRTWDIGVPMNDTNVSGKFYSFVIDDTQLGSEPELLVQYFTGNVGIGTTNPLAKLDVNGTIRATSIEASGSSLTALNASQLTSGTVSLARLPAAVLVNGQSGVTLSGTLSGNGAGLTNLNASQLTSGVIADALLSTNVAMRAGSNVFQGDQYMSRIFMNGYTNGYGRLGIRQDGRAIVLRAATDPFSAFVEFQDAKNLVAASMGMDGLNQFGGTNTFALGTYTSNGVAFVTSSTYRMIVDGAGRVGIANNNPTNLLMVANARCDGSSWINASDRNLKQDFATVDPQAVLDKVASLPIQSWSYKAQPDQKHVGPVAQDFRAAFGLGQDDTSIATVDADGVALAAIQGLNQKVEKENAGLRSENAELKARLEKIEQLLEQRLNGGAK